MTIIPGFLKNSRLFGTLEYYLYPRKNNSWGGGGPFNGQNFRQEIFKELLQQFKFQQIVETGSFRGISTEFMQSVSGLPVTSVEYNPRFFGFSSAKFARNPMVRLNQGDSRPFLQHHLNSDKVKTTWTFIYLDAHWHEDLPLKEELEIIHSSNVPAVIMIDDFEVPDDPSYSYDNYGEGRALNVLYLRGTPFSQRPWFFPSLAGHSETGAKRGTIVMATSERLMEGLRKCKTLREWNSSKS
ncbi:hypothetical protein [Verrucomicrobium spinosum]|uniref:hypothetical protein n=1 Tax=Verrucomicrobium spinosum TaxID=2736 RepID=UPI00017462E7|nr:hypothetical protein [Verrucomicrobium spinosum]